MWRNYRKVWEIVDAAREYALTIFQNDFCVEWGIMKYGLNERVKREDTR